MVSEAYRSLYGLTGHDIRFVAFADILELGNGNPTTVGFLVHDQLDALDLGIANFADDLAFIGAIMRCFGLKALDFSHFILFFLLIRSFYVLSRSGIDPDLLAGFDEEGDHQTQTCLGKSNFATT